MHFRSKLAKEFDVQIDIEKATSFLIRSFAFYDYLTNDELII